LRFRLRGTGGTTHASGALSILGSPAVLKRVDVIVGGLEVESIDNYNHYLSMIYKRQPDTYHHTLKELEQSAFDGSSNVVIHTSAGSNEAYICNHAMRVGLFEGQNNHIPLPFIRGGVELRFTLETNMAAIATGATLGNIVIDQVSVVCGLVKPSPSYLQEFQKSLEGGNEAAIPLQLVRNLNFVPNTGTEQEAVLNCGYISSLRSVMGAWKSGTAFNGDTRNNLTKYYWMTGNQRYPVNKQINTTATDAENIMFALASVDNTYNLMNAVPASATTGHLIYYNWCPSSAFGNGLAVPDAQLRFIQTYSAAPTTTSPMQLYITYDAKLKVSASSVQLDALNV
jgi:hypothetical protein